jgi:hypothetical protein
MNYLRNWMWLLLGCVLPLCAAAQTALVQLEVVPQTLELSSCADGAHLLVIARNPSNIESASDLELKTFADVPIQLQPGTAGAKKLKPGENISWDFKVTCTSGFSTGGLQVVLNSKLDRPRGALAQIVTKAVTVKLRDPQLLESIVTIDVKSTLESLTSGEKGELDLTVINKTERPVKMSIKPAGPFKFDPVDKSLTIAPFATEIVRFIVWEEGRVKVGKQLLVFGGQVETEGVRRDFLLTREINVGVLGESAVLKLLSVPSLLLLPGFLFMSSYLLLWRWKWLRHDDSTTPPVDEASSGFWLLSITLSIFISGAFWLYRRDFFSFYGLNDLIVVWLLSITLGCLAYLGWHHYLNRREEAKYPRPTDTPVEVLRKLQPTTRKMAVARVNIKGGKSPAFVLLQNEDGSAYVCPRMILTWAKNADPTLRDGIQNQLTSDGQLKTVLEAVEGELKKQKENQPSSITSLAWDSSDPVNPSAHKLQKDDLLAAQGPDIIVQESELH